MFVQRQQQEKYKRSRTHLLASQLRELPWKTARRMKFEPNFSAEMRDYFSERLRTAKALFSQLELADSVWIHLFIHVLYFQKVEVNLSPSFTSFHVMNEKLGHQYLCISEEAAAKLCKLIEENQSQQCSACSQKSVTIVNPFSLSKPTGLTSQGLTNDQTVVLPKHFDPLTILTQVAFAGTLLKYEKASVNIRTEKDCLVVHITDGRLARVFQNVGKRTSIVYSAQYHRFNCEVTVPLQSGKDYHLDLREKFWYYEELKLNLSWTAYRWIAQTLLPLQDITYPQKIKLLTVVLEDEKFSQREFNLISDFEANKPPQD